MNNINIEDRKILVVDDSSTEIEIYTEMLKLRGFVVESASDGVEALEKAESFNPDLFLIDVIMPNMNGLELLEKLKLHENVYEAIVITGHESLHDAQKIIEFGACSYIIKPVEMKELIRNVDNAINIISYNKSRARYENFLEQEIYEKNKKLVRSKEKYNTKIEAACQAKSALLSMVSHEIRTPLTSIMSIVKIIENTDCYDSKGEKKQCDLYDMLKEATDRLVVIINNMLDLSDMEYGDVILKESEFDFIKLVDVSLVEYRKRCKIKGIDLYSSIDKNIPDILVGDNRRIEQAIHITLDNAVKFTEDGYVRVDIVKLVESGNILRLKLTVTDSGIGISKDKTGKLFDAFWQNDSSLTRKYSGAGLGLPVAKKILEKMNGKITVDSEKGKGTSLIMEFDLKKPV